MSKEWQQPWNSGGDGDPETLEDGIQYDADDAYDALERVYTAETSPATESEYFLSATELTDDLDGVEGFLQDQFDRTVRRYEREDDRGPVYGADIVNEIVTAESYGEAEDGLKTFERWAQQTAVPDQLPSVDTIGSADIDDVQDTIVAYNLRNVVSRAHLYRQGADNILLTPEEYKKNNPVTPDEDDVSLFDYMQFRDA